jgi:CRP-like cAMP-binding protein
MRSEITTVDESLFARSELQRFATGRVLFEEGEKPAGVYILHSGEVVLSTLLEGHATRVRTARAGEMLGLMSVISDSPHLSSAVAASPGEVGFVEAAEFRSLIDASPMVWFSVLRQLSQDVNSSYDVMRARM